MKEYERDWGLTQRVFTALRENEGRSVLDITMEVRPKSDRMVMKTLYDLRAKCVASVTGNTHTSRWFRVPGAVLPEDKRGRRPGSRANLRQAKMPRKPPTLTWAELLK